MLLLFGLMAKNKRLNPLYWWRKLVESLPKDKYKEELRFWKGFWKELEAWGRGEVIYGTKPKFADIETDTQVLYQTWVKEHQMPKYAYDLEIDVHEFDGACILDLGNGPFANTKIFKGSKGYGLDPLLDGYIELGYPCISDDSFTYIKGFAENMPFEDNFFDAVLCMNSFDHFDDLEKVAAEIKRVLKPNGKLAMHVHYHLPTATEPLVLNDGLMLELFEEIEGFGKLNQKQSKFGYELNDPDQSYCLWRNF